MTDIMRLLRQSRTDGHNVSHKFIQISPSDTDRLLSNCQFQPVSSWALDLLPRQYGDYPSDVASDIYYNLKGMPDASLLRGHLFERQVLIHLSGLRNECTFSIRGLIDSNQMTWTCRPIRRVTFEESTVFDEITKAVQKREPVHLAPLARNFPAVDSILYDPDDQNAALTCIQITMNMDHPIVVPGLQLIQRWFKRDSSLEVLRPTIAKPWRFLFIVPSHMSSAFKLQTLKNDTPSGEWGKGKMCQYVVGLKEETIFGTKSSSTIRVQAPRNCRRGGQV